MATLTKAELLDLGAPFEEDPLNPQNPPEVGEAWRDAFYNGFIGTQEQPLGFGFFLSRIARIVTGAVVTADTHTAELPGPVLNVQATAGSSTGAKTIIVTGTPAAGSVRIDTDLADGRDTLVFAAGDAVTACAYRQQGMPQAMYDQLVADTVPPIDD